MKIIIVSITLLFAYNGVIAQSYYCEIERLFYVIEKDGSYTSASEARSVKLDLDSDGYAIKSVLMDDELIQVELEISSDEDGFSASFASKTGNNILQGMAVYNSYIKPADFSLSLQSGNIFNGIVICGQ